MENEPQDIAWVFSDMRTNGCDTKAPLKWGHFFFDPSLDLLWTLYHELKMRGYEFESCNRHADAEFVLQVSKTEVRTEEQLQAENVALERLAEQHGIATYDGWDVGRPGDENV